MEVAIKVDQEVTHRADVVVSDWAGVGGGVGKEGNPRTGGLRRGESGPSWWQRREGAGEEMRVVGLDQRDACVTVGEGDEEEGAALATIAGRHDHPGGGATG